jgi:hypothetical protein
MELGRQRVLDALKKWVRGTEEYPLQPTRPDILLFMRRLQLHLNAEIQILEAVLQFVREQERESPRGFMPSTFTHILGTLSTLSMLLESWVSSTQNARHRNYNSQHMISLHLHGALWDKVTPEMQTLRETTATRGFTRDPVPRTDDLHAEWSRQLEALGVNVCTLSSPSYFTLYDADAIRVVSSTAQHSAQVFVLALVTTRHGSITRDPGLECESGEALPCGVLHGPGSSAPYNTEEAYVDPFFRAFGRHRVFRAGKVIPADPDPYWTAVWARRSTSNRREIIFALGDSMHHCVASVLHWRTGRSNTVIVWIPWIHPDQSAGRICPDSYRQMFQQYCSMLQFMHGKAPE